ncbi:MAG: hypothetical protein OEV42_02250 [Deltaproteobacteria bacterium]|nr:hypothetical protein [Deltaproteobacteria bacterium]
MKIVVTRMSGLFLTIFLVVANAILIEIILDLFGVVKHRLITGIAGTSLIIFSFLYSMRKRKKLITFGKAKNWLQGHEWLSIFGTFIIFVHTGTHFTAIVPVITLIFMCVAFISGLIGRYVYNNAKAELKTKKKKLEESGLDHDEIEQRLWALTVASDALSKWRSAHMPIISFLGIMVIYHAISALYYSGF